MNYKQILSRFKNKNILIIGDVILDHYVEGTVNRISPEAPVPVVTVYKDDEYKLGGSGNVASNIVSLGAKASIVGIAGKDPRGDILRKVLKQKNINTEGLFDTNRRTTVKTRVIAHNQQVVRVDREDDSPLEDSFFIKIKSFLKNRINDHDGIIISDYKKGVVTKDLIKYINRVARKNNIVVAVDPKVGHLDYYRGVSLITPNQKEASEMSHTEIIDESTLVDAGKLLLNDLKCKAVLVTRGKDGMTLFEKDKRKQKIKTVAREVFDVTGAGDTVIAAFTLAYVSGASLKRAAEIANHAAGIVVGEVGTATTTADEIFQSLNHSS
jgi:D-beta-D-heptose 7-phosphate kinase/D-beta-D-heptose 1-phosphate adenosyltransferase